MYFSPFFPLFPFSVSLCADEEIDVVSIGDKNLPTNPTERDYRQLQSEVASKIRTASSRGAPNGAHTYGAGSHHHHHHHHSYQRHQHHLGDGPGSGLHHLGGIYPTPAGSTTISGANTPLPTGSGGASAASLPGILRFFEVWFTSSFSLLSALLLCCATSSYFYLFVFFFFFVE